MTIKPTEEGIMTGVKNKSIWRQYLGGGKPKDFCTLACTSSGRVINLRNGVIMNDKKLLWECKDFKGNNLIVAYETIRRKTSE